MNDNFDIHEKMRNFKAYLEEKIKGNNALIKENYNDIHEREKYRAISDAYFDCYKKLYGICYE